MTDIERAFQVMGEPAPDPAAEYPREERIETMHRVRKIRNVPQTFEVAPWDYENYILYLENVTRRMADYIIGSNQE